MDVQLTSLRVVAAAGSDAGDVIKAMRDAVAKLEFLPMTSVRKCRTTGPFGPGIAYELYLSVPTVLGDMLTAVRAAILWEAESELRRRHLAIPYVENQPRPPPLVLDNDAERLENANDAADDIRAFLSRRNSANRHRN